MKKNKMAAILSFVMAFVITACSTDAGGEMDLGFLNSLLDTSKKWVDSDLQGVITEDTNIRLQDDFAAAVNMEWKLQAGDKYYSILQQEGDAVIEKMKRAATDESIQGEEAELLRSYYALSSDWDYRDSQGSEPLRPYIEDIESISSTEELYEFFADLDRNPLALAPVSIDVLTGYHTEEYPDINITAITAPSLTMTDSIGKRHYTDLNSIVGLETYEMVENSALYILKQIGYSESEAKKKFKNCLMWEKKVFKADDVIDESSIEEFIGDRDTIIKRAGDFPLDKLLQAWGFGETSHFVMGTGYAKKLSSLCKRSNLERIKDYLIVNYCLRCAYFLDRKTYDAFDAFAVSKSEEEMTTGMSDEQLEDDLQFNFYIGSSSMIGALNKVYVENYFDDTTISELNNMTEDIIDGLEAVFSEESWLSEEGKKACIDKLSNIKIHIAYQSFDVLDYSNVSFLTKEEGGSFLEAYFATEKYNMIHSSFLSKQKFDRDYWDPLNAGLSTLQTNAFYNPETNGIYICAGICEPNAYSPEMAYEEKLAGLGYIIGHELTHGFDKSGSIYDKEGRRNDWLPMEDQFEFSDRDDNVAAYYSSLSPYTGSGIYAGSNLSGEATADMGGLKVVLYLASKITDFDYDLFFRSYARLWRENVPLEAEKAAFSGDPHPLAFYRINVGVQQFDEFYETYGVTEKDGMYLAPEKRIKVW